MRTITRPFVLANTAKEKYEVFDSNSQGIFVLAGNSKLVKNFKAYNRWFAFAIKQIFT